MISYLITKKKKMQIKNKNRIEIRTLKIHKFLSEAKSCFLENYDQYHCLSALTGI